MKKLFLASFLTLSVLASQSFAADVPPHSILQDYLTLQNLLAHDTFNGVSAAAHELSGEAKMKKEKALSEAAEALAQTKDIEAARLQFEKVSTLALPIFKKSKAAGVDLVYCPMKKARWVQKSGPIENPYYGKTMLECGVKEK